MGFRAPLHEGRISVGVLAAAVILKKLLFKKRHADRPQILPGRQGFDRNPDGSLRSTAQDVPQQ
jgi:hypothetical protein